MKNRHDVKISICPLLMSLILLMTGLCLPKTSAYAQSASSHSVLASNTQPKNYDEAMTLFEQAKKRGDWATGEKDVRIALQYHFTEYADNGLYWVIGLQGRHEEALKLSKQMVDRVGPTALSLSGYADEALSIGDIELADHILHQAEKLGLQHGSDWPNQNIVRFRQQVEESRTPAVYQLAWTIPNKDFPSDDRQCFLFPAMNHPSQKFTFHLTGDRQFKIIQRPDCTLVDIWPKPGSDVQVLGNATLTPQVIGPRTFANLATIPLAPAHGDKTGALYYYEERIDPAYGPCQSLAKTLTQPSAVETMQAILDWRSANITYAEPPAGNTLETILASHQGVCHHSAYLTVCLARAAGIPAFVIGGVMLPDQIGEFANVDGSHGWGEVELPSIGRISYESQNNGSLLNFVSRKSYLRFACQDSTQPYKSDYISLQGYPVSGRRIK